MLEIFWICFKNFRDIAKTCKLARRACESIKIEGSGGRDGTNIKKNASKFGSKIEVEHHPEMEPKEAKWSQNAANMTSTNLCFFEWFLGRLWKHRSFLDGAARRLRGSRDRHTFSCWPPRAAPYYQRILYNNKQGQDCLGDLARL